MNHHGSTSADGFKQPRYVEIAASILMFFATIWEIVQTVLHTPKVLFTKPSEVICIIAGILALEGCILFATHCDFKKFLSSDHHYHAGFALCIVAGVLSLAIGVLYMLARKNTKNMQQSQAI